MTTNSTCPAVPLPVPYYHVMALTFSSMMMALALENSMRGIATAIGRLQESTNKIIPRVIIVGNVLTILEVIGFAWSNFTNASTCFLINLLDNLAFHLFIVLFDTFLLYKTWLLTGKSRFFAALAAVVLAYRIAFGIRDVFTSYGAWDDQLCYCAWNSVPNSANLYMSGDVAADLLSSTTTILISVGFWKSDLRNLFRVLVLENATAITLWSINQANNDYSMYTAGLQAYAFAHLFNLEFYWFKQRSASLVGSLDDVSKSSHGMERDIEEGGSDVTRLGDVGSPISRMIPESAFKP
ncbi:hypothetical protein HDU98_001594 [Podochytrium sp. JEL0797]|nr:hypothetical protein HDU98_001594 [Podochytrium sp. JEL0797]